MTTSITPAEASTSPRPTTSNTRAAVLIMEHAERIGLPEPQTVYTSPYWTSFGVDNLEALTDWANWMEAPIRDYVDDGGNAHYNVDGLALEHTLNVYLVILAKDANR